jgi:outer membrane autotransporter protein
MPMIAVTPYAALQAQKTHTPAYSEMAVSGANTFALSYDARTSTATRVELGSWLDKVVALSNGNTVAWRGRAAWAHDHTGNQGMNAVFQTLPGSNFTVNGAAPPTNLALLTSGVEYRMAGGISFGAKFDTELASRSQAYAGTAMIRYAW